MKKKILVVDDEPNVRELLGLRLGPHYDVYYAEDGRSAYEVACRHIPDLILLDIMMPVLDGIGAANLLREDPRTAEIPILFLSSLAQGVEDSQLAASPRYRILAKPFEAQKLLSTIQEMIHQWGAV